FWAGVGLAIYPRGQRRPDAAQDQAPAGPSAPAGPILLYLPSGADAPGSPFPRIAGLPVVERVLRSAFRARYERAIVLADPAIEMKVRKIAREIRGAIDIVTTAEAWRDAVASIPEGTPVTVIGGGTIVSPALLDDAAALTGAGGAREVPAGTEWPVSGVLRVRAGNARDSAVLSRLLSGR